MFLIEINPYKLITINLQFYNSIYLFPKIFLMLRFFKYLIYVIFFTVRTEVIIRREALMFKQQIKVTLTHKLKVLVRYVVKFSAKVELFLIYF